MTRAIWAGAALGLAAGTAAAQEGERIEVTGEIIDTWCYFSGVMGGPEAVVGTAHHTCALWCSAGGIPVGLLTEEGDVYMVLKIGDSAASAGGDTQLSLAAHTVTADGIHYERDGIDYIVVEEVVSDRDIQTVNHPDLGPVPPFAIPEPE